MKFLRIGTKRMITATIFVYITIITGSIFLTPSNAQFQGVNTYQDNFKNAIDNPTDSSSPYLGDVIAGDTPLATNLRELGKWIYTALQRLGVVLLFGAFVFVGAKYLLYANDETERNKNGKNIVFILYGTALFFGTSWIMSALGINEIDRVNTINEVEDIQRNAIEQIITPAIMFLKYLTYFIAIIMIIYYGYRVVAAYDQEERVRTAKSGLINVIVSLLFIRAITFVYDIAGNGQTLRQEGTEILVNGAQILGIVLGMVMVGLLIYSGVRLIASGGDESARSLTTKVIRNVFVVGIVVILFMFIIYQLFLDLGPLDQYTGGGITIGFDISI